MTTIRLWRLGYIDKDNPSNSLLPTAESLRKLKDLINNNTSGGILDIIWGPDLSLDVITHPDSDDVVDVIELLGEEE
jgi:hypothetical protein